MLTTYIAVVLGYWGRGDTEQDALEQVRKAGAKRFDRTIIYRNERSEDAEPPTVDGYGNIVYHGTLTKVSNYVRGKRKPTE